MDAAAHVRAASAHTRREDTMSHEIRSAAGPPAPAPGPAPHAPPITKRAAEGHIQ